MAPFTIREWRILYQVVKSFGCFLTWKLLLNIVFHSPSVMKTENHPGKSPILQVNTYNKSNMTTLNFHWHVFASIWKKIINLDANSASTSTRCSCSSNYTCLMSVWNPRPITFKSTYQSLCISSGGAGEWNLDLIAWCGWKTWPKHILLNGDTPRATIGTIPVVHRHRPTPKNFKPTLTVDSPSENWWWIPW